MLSPASFRNWPNPRRLSIERRNDGRKRSALLDESRLNDTIATGGFSVSHIPYRIPHFLISPIVPTLCVHYNPPHFAAATLLTRIIHGRRRAFSLSGGRKPAGFWSPESRVESPEPESSFQFFRRWTLHARLFRNRPADADRSGDICLFND